MSSPDQGRIDDFHASVKGAGAPRTNGHHVGEAVSVHSDDDVINLCRRATNAAKFVDLFDDGDVSAYENDESAADSALFGILKFYTRDPEQLDRIMRRSALARSKWD